MKRRIWRYLLVKVISNGEITEEGLSSALFLNMGYLFGKLSLVKTCPRVLYFKEESNKAIIRCNHESINEVRASLALITKINDNSAAIHIIRVSGTIKGLKELMKKQKIMI